MEKELLINLGLTDGEAKVYLALAKLGSSTVGPIVKEAKVAYSNIYEILNRLLEKGLISFIIKEKTKYFQVTNFSQLYEYLNKKEQEIEKEKQSLKKLIPDLEKLKSLKVKQEADVFIGFNGVRTAYERLMESNKDEEYLFFYIAEENYEEIDKFWMHLYHKFKNLKVRGIANIKYKKSTYIKKTKFKMKYINFPIPGNIDIHEDKVLFTSFKDKPLATLIMSRDIANKFKEYFYSIWGDKYKTT
jgi:sugar-specific transcriptional regulator TrmB